MTKIGTATIDGVQTTGYRAQINLDKVAAKLEAKGGSKAGQAVHREEQILGTHDLPVEAWIGPRGLVRRIAVEVPFGGAGSGSSQSGKATLNMTFSGFGTPVHIVGPPPSQTTDITAQVVQADKAGLAS